MSASVIDLWVDMRKGITSHECHSFCQLHHVMVESTGFLSFYSVYQCSAGCWQLAMNCVPYMLGVMCFLLCYVGTLCEGHGEFCSF